MENADVMFKDPVTKFIYTNTICIPLGTFLLFLISITLCLLFKKHQLGLLCAYLFAFYAGFIFNGERFIDQLEQTASGFYIYIGFGVIIAIMVIIGFIQDSKAVETLKSKLQPAPKKPMFRMVDDLNPAEGTEQ